MSKVLEAEAPLRRAEPVVREAGTPDAILAAAAELFGRQGYVATTLRQIAGAAGVRAGSIDGHFQGKDEIAARVLDADAERAPLETFVHQVASLVPDGLAAGCLA